MVKRLSKNYECRTFPSEVRMKGDNTIEGYAAVFNTYSDDLGGFIEMIMPGAFEGRDGDDVVCLFNHDKNIVLGRSPKNTKITIDTNGLGYETKLPNTQWGRDVKELVEREDVSKSSFGFHIARDGSEWGENEKGQLIHTVKRVSRLFDVGPVVFPAYQDTSVSSRSLEEYQSLLQERNKKIVQENLAVFEKRMSLIDRIIEIDSIIAQN